jgi:radical SAM/Cys-rich protein
MKTGVVLGTSAIRSRPTNPAPYRGYVPGPNGGHNHISQKRLRTPVGASGMFISRRRIGRPAESKGSSFVAHPAGPTCRDPLSGRLRVRTCAARRPQTRRAGPCQLKGAAESSSSQRELDETAVGARAVSRQAAFRDLSKLEIPSFDGKLDGNALNRRVAKTLQINIGLTCNLACRHCHVASSPSRRETMTRQVADRIIALTALDSTVSTVDITGGAPEMHEQFRYLVDSFRSAGLRVIDRCNLSVLGLPGQEDLADYLMERRVRIVASLPCYTPSNVEAQRGDGVFDASIQALQDLNACGYGIPDTGLELDLVFNPGGATLPPPQRKLEEDYRRELQRCFGIQFSHLICITNMPIKRFADDLRRSGKLAEYMQLLVQRFNPATVDSVMCRDMIHVAWDGRLYDCDFNYALDLTLDGLDGQGIPVPNGLDVFDISSWSELSHRKIRTGPHCFGCTAGSGSSCGGALAE